jgi:hypothetical protein
MWLKTTLHCCTWFQINGTTPVTDTAETGLADQNSIHTSNMSTDKPLNNSSTTEPSYISRTDDAAAIIRVITITIGVVGILGNLFAILVFVYHQPLRKRIPNYFLISQSVLDLIVGLVLIINTTLVLDNPTGFSLIVKCFVFDSPLLMSSSLMASTWNLVALAIERYTEIVHPIRHKLTLTKKKVVAAIVSVILGCLIYKVILNFTCTRIINGKCVSPYFRDSRSKTAIFAINAFLEFFLPVGLIAFSYIEMARAVHRKVNVSTSTNSQMMRARKNILKIFSIIVICFVLCVGPRRVS